MTDFHTWTPREGDVVHYRNDAKPAMTGRYTVEISPAGARYGFNLRSQRDGTVTGLISPPVLPYLCKQGIVTPIDPADIERERKALELRTIAPLRSRSAQHDVDGLGLFDHHRSPGLF